MSAYSHIHPDFRYVFALSDQERINFMQAPRWLSSPVADQVLSTLQGLLLTTERPKMQNLLLLSDPNNGKTTIVRRFYDLCGQSYVNEDGELVKPVVLAESPPRASEKELYICLLDRFHAPFRGTEPAFKLRYQLIHLCRATHVRMIIIDEFHSMLQGTSRQQREVMNTLKLLCNELRIPIVGVGTKEAALMLHSEPQHASRFDVMTMPLWKLDADFQRLLAGFEQILPLKLPSGLAQSELARPLHLISRGNLGDLHRLLMECAKQAIVSGAERIDQKLIEKNTWVRQTKGVKDKLSRELII